LRDAGDPLPAAAACMSPWTDLALSGPSVTAHAGNDPTLSAELLRVMANCYVRENDPLSPLISPLYADLNGLPPLLLQVGKDELLLSDSTTLAERASQAGVDVTLRTWDGAFHGWQAFAWLMPEGRRAIEEVGAFLARHLK